MSADLPLLIDQQGATVRLSAEELSAWAEGQRVFVSSLINDMRDERAAARAAIESFGATPVMFEIDLGGQDVSAEKAYLAGVRTSDVYLGLLGARYGVRLESGYSATHAEFLEAERLGLRLAIFSREGAEFDGAQRDLLDGIRSSYTSGSWATDEDLRTRIGARLRDIAAESLAPWVKVGRTIFRANSVESSNDQLGIRATIRDSRVLNELKAIVEQRQQVPFATVAEAREVQALAMTTQTQVQNRTDVTLRLAARPDRRNPMRMSVNGISAEELAKTALSDGLFGTTTLPTGTLGFGTRAVDPLLPLRGLGLADAILRPISHLLIAEHLFSEDEAQSVDIFKLGPTFQGRRHLQVGWIPPRRYSNSPDAEQVVIEGTVGGL